MGSKRLGKLGLLMLEVYLIGSMVLHWGYGTAISGVSANWVSAIVSSSILLGVFVVFVMSLMKVVDGIEEAMKGKGVFLRVTVAYQTILFLLVVYISFYFFVFSNNMRFLDLLDRATIGSAVTYICSSAGVMLSAVVFFHSYWLLPFIARKGKVGKVTVTE